MLQVYATSTPGDILRAVLSEDWTVALFAPANPDRFLFEHGLHKIEDLGYWRRLDVEVYFISLGLLDICAVWTKLLRYLDFMLRDADDAVLSPSDHDQLFFDDAVFSRSRKYFWAIDILTQTDSLISDNMKQWAEWKRLNIDVFEALVYTAPLVEGLELADRSVSELLRIRDAFRRNLQSFQVLRDGVSIL